MRPRVAASFAFGLVVACAAFACFPSLDSLVGDGTDAAPDGVTDTAAPGDGPLGDADLSCGADVTKDPKNCGSCRVSCLGSSCVSGRCQPVRLATGLDATDAPGFSALVVDDTAAWLLAGGVLTKVPLVEGAVPAALPFKGRNLDADTDYLYLLTLETSPPSNGALMKLRKSDPATGPVVLSPKSSLADAIGVGGNLVAFGTYGSIRTVTKDGVDAGLGVDRDSGLGLGSVAVSAGEVYYYLAVGGGEIRQIGGDAALSNDNVDLDTRIRADETGLVWATDTTGKIQLRTTSGTTFDVMKDVGTSFGGLALDPSYVYVTAPANGAGKVLRAPRSGAGPTETLADTTSPREIAVSKHVVAWVTRDSGTKQSLWIVAR